MNEKERQIYDILKTKSIYDKEELIIFSISLAESLSDKDLEIFRMIFQNEGFVIKRLRNMKNGKELIEKLVNIFHLLGIKEKVN